jgi:hypothetical protein
MRWVEFDTPGLYAFLRSSQCVERVGGIRIQYTPHEGLYDLISITDHVNYIWGESFRTVEEAVSTAQKNI